MQVSGSGVPGLEPLCRATSQHGLGHLWKCFESRLSELFVDSEDESRIGVVIEKEDRAHWVSSLEEVCRTIEGGMSTLIIFNRYNSWSRIDITAEAFSMICDHARITPFFLHFVVGMGAKFSSNDEDFMACYSTFLSEEDRPASKPETRGGSLWAICYNIRHFERHNRDLEDPWSCRQSALHHSFMPISKKSVWVTIQPPEVFDLTIRSSTHPMYLHVQYLQAAIANWREYLDSFAQRFKVLNQQIAIPNPYRKFKINFSHEQHLHLLKGKLHHARTILVNTKNTFNVIVEHECLVAREQNLSLTVHEEFQRRLRNISCEVDTYIETTYKLLCISDDLKSMYSNILTFHGQELQHETSLKLAYLAQDDATGNKDMAVLADLTYKDSRSMRIATAIAMFYLPVNLVLSFFSTTLVWYGTAAEVVENDNSKIHVRSEVWYASVAATLLAIGTVCWASWWNWREQRKSNKNGIQKPKTQP
ncbi:hypothetical protein F4679DRAFT_542383 [Xylaria curta]|nr:hypothetical protein F4679DRAFT_542383 [Xylaria curta]